VPIDQPFDILIVGGGAAGLAAAIFTARRWPVAPLISNNAHAPRPTIAVLEGAKKPGAKILVSGGGRCNLTNVRVLPDDFWGGSRNTIRCILNAFPAEKTADFFRELGVPLHEEEIGKLFPDTNNAHTVLNALLHEADRLGVRLLSDHRVIDIAHDEQGFVLTVTHGWKYQLAPHECGPGTLAEVDHVAPAPLPVCGTGNLPVSSDRPRNECGTGFQPVPSVRPRYECSTDNLSRSSENSRKVCGTGFQPVLPSAQTAITPQQNDLPLFLRARSVVLATGGLSLPKTGSDGHGYQLAQKLGHSLIPTTPGLAPLILYGCFHTELSGVSHDVQITIAVRDEKPIRLRGAMLWTHFGVSGPVALDASRHWERARLEGRDVRVTASFLPDCDFAAADRRLLELGAAHPKRQLHNALSALIPARVADALLTRLEIAHGIPMTHLPKDLRLRLVHALIEFPLPVRGTRGYAHAEVTAGGVPISEINPATLESRLCPGLFLVGEILDVDGRIGGFNFQWAWSTAFVAGEGLSQRLCPKPV